MPQARQEATPSPTNECGQEVLEHHTVPFVRTCQAQVAKALPRLLVLEEPYNGAMLLQESIFVRQRSQQLVNDMMYDVKHPWNPQTLRQQATDPSTQCMCIAAGISRPPCATRSAFLGHQTKKTYIVPLLYIRFVTQESTRKSHRLKAQTPKFSLSFQLEDMRAAKHLKQTM